jgi:hypothetical protein
MAGSSPTLPRRCLWLVLFVVLTAGTAIGAGPRGPDARRVAAMRIEVPIRQTLLTNGVIGYSVPVKIGNASPANALLDTGSTGLRVLRARFPSRLMRPATNRAAVFRVFPPTSVTHLRGLPASSRPTCFPPQQGARRPC